MAISTYKTFLMLKGADATYEKFLDIKSFPDLGSAPDTIQTTTLSDAVHTYIMGVQDTGLLEFDANYDKDDYQKCLALKGEQKDWAIWLGGTGTGQSLVPTGSEGIFEFKGELSAWVTGGTVNDATGMNLAIAPSTEIEFRVP